MRSLQWYKRGAAYIPKTVHKERMQENLNICIKIIRMENYGRKIIDYIFG